MANPTTYFGWVMPNSADLVTDLPADFNVFGQGVDTSMSQLLGGTTGQVLSKTSATNMAFTWTTPTDQTPLTTKGDLFTFSTVDARLPVGTNNQTLVADSTASTGLKWATPSGSAMTLISRTTFSNVASETFDNVFTSTYENYVVYFNSMGATSSNDDFQVAPRYAGPVEQNSTQFNRMGMIVGSTTVTGISQSGTGFITMNNSTGSSANPGQGVMYFSNVGNTGNKGSSWGQYVGENASDTAWCAGSFPSGASTNLIVIGFKVFTASSNISGTVTIYGLAKS